MQNFKIKRTLKPLHIYDIELNLKIIPPKKMIKTLITKAVSLK